MISLAREVLSDARHAPVSVFRAHLDSPSDECVAAVWESGLLSHKNTEVRPILSPTSPTFPHLSDWEQGVSARPFS